MYYLRNRKRDLKKAIAIIFIAVLYFGFFVPKSKAVGIVDATLLFNPASTSVSAESDFNLVARVDPGSNTVDGDGVNAVQVDITFNPDVLQLNSMTTVIPFAAFNTPEIDNVAGTASAVFYIAGDDVITVSDVATLSFHAQTSATDTDSPVEFAASANATVSDGLGTQVVPEIGGRISATVTVTGVSYTVGGTATGLNGTAVLQNNGGNNLSVSANGSFTFSTGLTNGATYDVSILTQPTGQTCILSNNTGTIATANVTNIWLTCMDILILSAGSPSGTLSAGTTSATVSVTTNESATCRYATSSGVAFASMTNNFSDSGTAHTFSATGLTNGSSYGYFVRCQDEDENMNTSEYLISFSVASSTNTSDNDSHHSSNKKKKKKSTAARTISVSKKSIKKGQTIIERGKKFSKLSNVALYFEKSKGVFYPPRIIKTTSSGGFSLSYKIPFNKPLGTYKWYAVDLKTGKKSKTISFKVK